MLVFPLAPKEKALQPEACFSLTQPSTHLSGLRLYPWGSLKGSSPVGCT